MKKARVLNERKEFIIGNGTRIIGSMLSLLESSEGSGETFIMFNNKLKHTYFHSNSHRWAADIIVVLNDGIKLFDECMPG